jgi:tetratricopeptide (TPR) repeat protein
MPQRRIADALPRACPARSAGSLPLVRRFPSASPWLAAAVCLLAAASGCRALSTKKTNDDAISAARMMSLQGMDAQQKGRWDHAESLYAAAVERCPTDERARCGYAECLWQRGAQDEAVGHMEEAVRLSGDDPERLVQLGGMYLAQGQLGRAAQQAEQAIAANRQLAKGWALRGDVLRAQGELTDALASYHRALSLQEHYPEVQFAVAEIYCQDRRPQRALATLQSLGDFYPPGAVPSNVLYRQGLVLRQLGRYQDAAQALAAATEKGEPSAEMLYELAQTHLLAGDPANANLAATAALARYPNHTGLATFKQELDGRQHRMTAGNPNL